MPRFPFAVLALACLLPAVGGDEPDKTKEPLALTAAQKECLALEPILVVVRLGAGGSVPARVGETKGGPSLSFDIKPAVKVRAGAKPLPLEGSQEKVARKARMFDLLEWYQFPAEGEFTIKAVVRQGATTVTSRPITEKLRKPDRKDAEWGPVDRIHHVPWSNYVTNAFCGDTFDVVKRWPDSKLTKYCHYYNGLHHLHRKEYDRAVASLRTVVEKYPGFLLAPDADDAVHQCLVAQGKKEEAARHLSAMQTRWRKDTTGRLALAGRSGKAQE